MTNLSVLLVSLINYSNKNQITVRRFLLIMITTLVGMLAFSPSVMAQRKERADEVFVNDTLPLLIMDFDSVTTKTTDVEIIMPREVDPMKAVWLAAVFPGAGQIYNRQLWKLPILYGGFLGLTYGMSWNQRYYNGYANAYRDLVEDNPSKSYLDYVPPGYNVEQNRSFLESALKRKKDFYRRNRDLTIISMVGVYLVSIIDAYVDASLYNFDISPDVAMRVEPTVMMPGQVVTSSTIQNTSIGLQWSIKF